MNETTVWLRVTSPARDAPLLGKLSGLGPLTDAEQLVEMVGPHLASAIDLTLPVDFAWSVAPVPGQVLAAGVGSAHALAEHLGSSFELAALDKGRWRVTSKGADTLPLSCEVWEAAPPVNARLICADFPDLIAAQGPFLMSQHELSPRVSLHVVMPSPASTAFIAQATSADRDEKSPKTEPERVSEQFTLDLVSAEAAQLKAVTWDVQLDDDSASIAEQVSFSKTETPLSLALAGHGGEHAPIPETFWSLPATSDVAWYSEGSDPVPTRQAWAPCANVT